MACGCTTLQVSGTCSCDPNGCPIHTTGIVIGAGTVDSPVSLSLDRMTSEEANIIAERICAGAGSATLSACLTPTCNFTVEAGTTASAGDASLGSAEIGCGDTIHFHSPDGSIGVALTQGSALVSLTNNFDLNDLCALLDGIPSVGVLQCS